MTGAPGDGPRVLQPVAWRRAGVRLVVAAVGLGLVLGVPMGGLLLLEGTPPWLPLLGVAAVTLLAIGGGLVLAYPRVLVDASGALHVRGRRVPPEEIVGVLRSLSSGGGLPSLVYFLQTAHGPSIRVMVAGGAPVAGLREPQLRVLRDVIAASAIPDAEDADAAHRSVVGENMLGTGRRVPIARALLLRELDGALTPLAVAGSEPAVDVVPLEPAEFLQAAEVDDEDARRSIAALPAGLRILRRIGVLLLVLTSLASAVLLVVMVVIEANGRRFGPVTEEPLVAVLLGFFAAVGAAALLWAIAADRHDAQLRRAGTRWLREADPEQRRRGLPAPFHLAATRTPGGRMLAAGLALLLMIAMVGLIGGPVALAETAMPPAFGIGLLLAGIAASVAAAVGYLARRRARRRRIERFLEAAGERVTAG